MEELLEELRGSGTAAILAGILLVFLITFFSGSGMISGFVREFLNTIGGGGI